MESTYKISFPARIIFELPELPEGTCAPEYLEERLGKLGLKVYRGVENHFDIVIP